MPGLWKGVLERDARTGDEIGENGTKEGLARSKDDRALPASSPDGGHGRRRDNRLTAQEAPRVQALATAQETRASMFGRILTVYEI
jgi:hypothetical protein